MFVDDFVCTGTLVSQNVLLTSLSCFESELPGGTFIFDDDKFDNTVVFFEVEGNSGDAFVPVSAFFDERFFTFSNSGSSQFIQYDALFLVLNGTPGARLGFAEVLNFDAETSELFTFP